MPYSRHEKPPGVIRGVLIEHLRLLIRLRWIACIGIVVAGLVSTKVFSVLATAAPVYICAALLLVLNVVYRLAIPKKGAESGSWPLVLGMCQVEMDLIILTSLLHFSGGITNPFVLFYVFHIILATIILPNKLSFSVGISAIAMFGVMAAGELNNWPMLEHVDPLIPTENVLWRNPVYVLGEFVAFVATVLLTQYLTRTVITRMTAKELEAARNHDVLRAMIKAMAEGLVFVTTDGRVPICNPAAHKWAGQGDIQSESLRVEDFPPLLASHIRQLLDTDPAVGGGLKGVQFNLDDSQKSFIEAKSCPVVGIDGAKLGYVIVGQDLTEHKKLEQDLMERTEETTEINEMLKRSRIEMAQREKMVAIGQMATGIAHEIGNPLASLSSVAQYLARKLTRHEDKEQLLMIENQVDRISTILRRMLSLSRPATSEYKWVDVNALIDNTLALIRFDRRARSVEIRSVPNSRLPTVWLNPLHFEQVLLNITINALDAMSAKKTQEANVLEITRRFADEMIEIRISDTGIGMEPQVCRRAFESFFTTKEIGKGTGLGLFISYNLINELDGTINLDSQPDKGTTVTIRVPVRPKKHLISGLQSDKEATASTRRGSEDDGKD
ncbi:MAG: hypothetical protein DRP66_11510 [Planctomycetota bacterium]|nr:MAG: hypothetical protein DRP66_11510 [Planctomycetota bacterium]